MGSKTAPKKIANGQDVRFKRQRSLDFAREVFETLSELGLNEDQAKAIVNEASVTHAVGAVEWIQTSLREWVEDEALRISQDAGISYDDIDQDEIETHVRETFAFLVYPFYRLSDGRWSRPPHTQGDGEKVARVFCGFGITPPPHPESNRFWATLSCARVYLEVTGSD